LWSVLSQPDRLRPVNPPPTRWALPSPLSADHDGIVGIGGDLEPGTLLAAYRRGLFPMPYGRKRIVWFSPDPRAVLPLDGLRVSKSLRRSIRRYTVTRDAAFAEVMVKCGDPRRPGAWINAAIVEAYTRLHQLGWAHSFEARDDDGRLVGGLYGVRVGGFFAGESMFHHATDASKVALVGLVEWLNATDARLLDVQWPTPHLNSLGVITVTRDDYLHRLSAAVA
jgi:leucyl/phenylalanyl-tRNA--protein transferase